MVILFCNFQICSTFGLEVTMRNISSLTRYKLFLSKLYRKTFTLCSSNFNKIALSKAPLGDKKIEHIPLKIDITINILYNYIINIKYL